MMLIKLILNLLFLIPLLATAEISTQTTYVLERSQYTETLKKFGATEVYLMYWGPDLKKSLQERVFRGDTVINYQAFGFLMKGVTGFRLIYKTNAVVDSVWQLDVKFRINYKAYRLEDPKFYFIEVDSTMKKTDEFIHSDYYSLSPMAHKSGTSLEKILRNYELYSSYERGKYSLGAVWVLSIGIDDYEEMKYKTCRTDAQSYTDFFRQQFLGSKSASDISSLFHEYVLLDKDASRDSILAVLKEIAGKAAFNDFFIFNFSGSTTILKKDSIEIGTFFLPYDVTSNLKNRNKNDTTQPLNNCISLKLLQEYFQSIAAVNQLFISEAGPSEKFKTEFIKTLMQNSPEVAAILNKNRIIIVPNGTGYDDVRCENIRIEKGPINHYITSLTSGNIFDLFNEFRAGKIAFEIKYKSYTCKSFSFDYFDIFFERKFLKEYKEIFDDGAGQTRGLGIKAKELRSAANFSGKQYALVVGTNNYKGAGWKKLPNAINDARAVSDMLAQGYGFEVQLLEDKPMDTIYKAIAEYYRNLQTNDQLIIYFAGHGDMEDEFMDDGFIVCSDSKSRTDDPARNTYIQYVKLQKMINRIPARQILVMLDVCHGGSFNQKRNDPAKTITNRNVRQFLVDQSQYTCRKFLSSVGTQEAFDGKPGDHSPFAKLLLQILNAKGKETNGIITLSEIFSVLQISSTNETATLKISPQKDGFGKDDPQSDFIFIPVDKEQPKQ